MSKWKYKGRIDYMIKELKELKDVNSKLNYLYNWKFEHEQYRVYAGDELKNEMGEDYNDTTEIDWVNLEIKRLEIMKELSRETEKDRGAEVPILKKIEWKGSPALFGYLFTELVKNGFIEPPLYNGEPSYSGLAKLCFQYFNVNETTLDNLKKEMNPNKNTLSETKRAKFPNLSDLA